jgi:hypothetical protein
MFFVYLALGVLILLALYGWTLRKNAPNNSLFDGWED